MDPICWATEHEKELFFLASLCLRLASLLMRSLSIFNLHMRGNTVTYGVHTFCGCKGACGQKKKKKNTLVVQIVNNLIS